jgi:hypothetical protein
MVIQSNFGERVFCDFAEEKKRTAAPKISRPAGKACAGIFGPAKTLETVEASKPAHNMIRRRFMGRPSAKLMPKLERTVNALIVSEIGSDLYWEGSP